MGEDAAVLVGGLMFHSNTGHQTKKKKKNTTRHEDHFIVADGIRE